MSTEQKALEREADPNADSGMVRTSLYCHECTKNFLARVDFDIDGNHIIECPHCGHEHCRVIEAGKITGDRWDSRHGRVSVEKRNVWKHTDLKIETSLASAFLRERWLNRWDAQA